MGWIASAKGPSTDAVAGRHGKWRNRAAVVGCRLLQGTVQEFFSFLNHPLLHLRGAKRLIGALLLENLNTSL